MKRLLSLLVCFLLIVPVMAAEVVYTDEVSGLQFSLPEGWGAPVQSENEAGRYTFFYCETQPELFIGFTVVDFYAALQKPGQNRSDYNNTMLPMATVCQLLGCREEDLLEQTWGGRTYYYLQAQQGPVKNYMMRMENGYLYIFNFSGEQTHERYTDFLTMLVDVRYPQAHTSDKELVLWDLLALALALIFHMLPIVLYRFGIKKAPVADAKGLCIVHALCAGGVALFLPSLLPATTRGAAVTGIAIAGLINYRLISK